MALPRLADVRPETRPEVVRPQPALTTQVRPGIDGKPVEGAAAPQVLPVEYTPTGGTQTRPVEGDPRLQTPAGARPAEDRQAATTATNAFLTGLRTDQQAAGQSLVRSPAFRDLPPSAQTVLLQYIQGGSSERPRDGTAPLPSRLEAALAWTSAPTFQRADSATQRRMLEQIALAGVASAPARAMAIRAATSVDQRTTVPTEISIVFPGQRATLNSRGEFQDVMSRARQAASLFPDARINVVVFDPPETLAPSDYHPVNPQSRPDGNWRTFREERNYRSFDYMHETLGSERWNPQERSTFQHGRFNFVYATAPANGRPTDGRAIVGEPRPDAGEQYRLVRETAPDGQRRTTHMELTERSLGYQAIARSQLTIVGGAGDINDPRILNLGRPGSPQSNVMLQFQEAGFRMAAGGRVQAIDSSLFSASPTTFSDFSSDQIDAMRRYVGEYRPQQGADMEAVVRNRTELLSRFLPPERAAELARTHWATAYARLDQERATAPMEAGELRAWSTAARTSADAARVPTTAFVTVPRGRHPEFLQRLQAEFPGQTTPLDGGLTGFRTGNLNVVLVDQQPQATFRSLVAGSTRPSLLTGNNSLADGVAAGTPIVYETGGGTNSSKIHDLVLAAPGILRRAGYPQAAINAFIWSLPSLVNHGADGQTTYVPAAESGTREQRARIFAHYQGPDLESVRLLAARPEYAQAMWQTVSQAVARDDSATLRAGIVRDFQASRDPRARLIAAALNDGSFEGLMRDSEFRAWMDNPANASHRDLIRRGALVGASGAGMSVASAFAGQAFADVTGITGMPRVFSDMAIGMGVQSQGAALTARAAAGLRTFLPNAVPAAQPAGVTPTSVTGRELFNSTLRGMPRGFASSAIFTSALRAAGIDPGTYGTTMLTAGATTAADFGGAALTNYLRLAGYSRLSGVLGVGGRVLGYAGLPLLADFVGGGIAQSTGAITEYDQQVAMLGRQLDRNGGFDTLGTLMPTTATLSGASEPNMVAARRIIYESAVSTEGALNNGLAGVLRASNGSYNVDGFAAFQHWMRDEGTQQAITLMRGASQSTQHPFRSELMDGLVGIRTRSDYERFVRDRLPVITRGQQERAASELTREAALTGDMNPQQRQERLTGMLHRMAAAATLDDTVRAVPRTGISGITDDQVDAMTRAMFAGEYFPRDAAAVLIARGGYARFAENIRNAPNTTPIPAIWAVVDRATPAGPGIARQQGEEQRETAATVSGMLALSRALGNDQTRRDVLRDRLDRRLIMGANPTRVAEFIEWTARHGSREDQTELASLLQNVSIWNRRGWPETVAGELTRLGVTLPPTMQPLATRLATR